MARLRINPLVVEDLKEIKRYIGEDNPEAAAHTINSIYNRFEYICQFPLLGSELSRRVGFRTDLKYLIWENYVILYRYHMSNSCIDIQRVVNRFQDITKIFDESE